MVTKKTKTSAKVPSAQQVTPAKRGRPPKSKLPEPLAKDPVSKAIGTTLPSQTPPAEPALQKNLRQRPAASLQSAVRIFQIYYETWQRELLDPNFIALDNGKMSSELMEFAVFERLAKSDYVKGAQLWGALSWRFTERTGMSGADWLKAIGEHPGPMFIFATPYLLTNPYFIIFGYRARPRTLNFLHYVRLYLRLLAYRRMSSRLFCHRSSSLHRIILWPLPNFGKVICHGSIKF
jgi:hypothetical protein